MLYTNYKVEDLILINNSSIDEKGIRHFNLEAEMTDEEKFQFINDYAPSTASVIKNLNKLIDAVANDEVKITNWNKLNMRSVQAWIKRERINNMVIKTSRYSDKKYLKFNYYNTEKEVDCVWGIKNILSKSTESVFHTTLCWLCDKEVKWAKDNEENLYKEQHKESINAGKILYALDNANRVSVATEIVPDTWRDYAVKYNKMNGLDTFCSENRILHFNNYYEATDTEGNLLTINQVYELTGLELEYGKKVAELNERFLSKAKAIVEESNW